MITKKMVNDIYKHCMVWKDEEGYSGELLTLAYNNNMWNDEILALALMLAGESPKYSMSEITMLELINKCVVKKDGSRFDSLSDNEREYAKLVIENNLYEKYFVVDKV